MSPAIHIKSRSWLRSSSTHEPSDPPLRVISEFVRMRRATRRHRTFCKVKQQNCVTQHTVRAVAWGATESWRHFNGGIPPRAAKARRSRERIWSPRRPSSSDSLNLRRASVTRRPLARLARRHDVDPTAVDRRPPRDAIVASTGEAAIRGSEVPKHASEQKLHWRLVRRRRRVAHRVQARQTRDASTHTLPGARRQTQPGISSHCRARRRDDTRRVCVPVGERPDNNTRFVR